MIVYLPFAVFALGAVVAYGSAGRRRQLGTVLLVLAAAWSLALLVEPRAMAWAIGPLLATWLLPRPGKRVRSTFEVLSRRAVTLAVLSVLAVILASRLAFGENPLLLNAVPWLLGAVGAAWVVSPIDGVERLQGQVLLVAATGGLLLVAAPAGIVTAGLTGASAILPVLGERARTPATVRPLLSSLLLLAAGVAALAAASGVATEPRAVFDVSINLAGPALLAAAIVLVAGALRAPAGVEWSALVGVAALVAAAPSLRWSAVAALVAIATALDQTGERPAWLAVAALASAPFIQAVGLPTWSARFQTVALGVGLVIMVYAAKHSVVRVLVLPAGAFLVWMSVDTLAPSNVTRFQWVVAAGALLLAAIATIDRLRTATAPTVVLADRLLGGLLLLATGAHDPLGLGPLALAILVIDLSVVRLDDLPGTISGFGARLVELARSNWPPSATFAAASLAVVAALQASLALGLLAAIWWAALQVAPMVDHRTAPGPERPRASLRWLGPVIGLAVGLAPSVVLRMLRL